MHFAIDFILLFNFLTSKFLFLKFAVVQNLLEDECVSDGGRAEAPPYERAGGPYGIEGSVYLSLKTAAPGLVAAI